MYIRLSEAGCHVIQNDVVELNEEDGVNERRGGQLGREGVGGGSEEGSEEVRGGGGGGGGGPLLLSGGPTRTHNF